MPEFTVGGVTYTYTPLNLRASRNLALRLAKVLAPAMGSLDGASREAIGSAVAKVIPELDEGTLDILDKTLAPRCTFTDGDPGDIRLDKCLEVHFQGRLYHYLSWLGECVMAEFGEGFLDLLAPDAPHPPEG